MSPASPDRPGLSDLVHRYAAAADDRDLVALRALFTEEAVLVLPQPPARLDACRTVSGTGLDEEFAQLANLPVTAHEIVGEVYDAGADPTTASGRIACVAHHVSDEGDLVWHLHYRDVYRRGSDGWRISRRALNIDFIEARSVKRHRQTRHPQTHGGEPE